MEQKNLFEIGDYLEGMGIMTLEELKKRFQLNVAISTFTIEVPKVSLADAIEAGSYEWVGDGFNEDTYPSVPTDFCKKEVTLFWFNRLMSFANVRADMNEAGFGPAPLRELLAFGTTYPKLQREYPIIALGRLPCDSHGRCLVPELWHLDGKRCLYSLAHVGDRRGYWRGYYRFLAVPK